MTHQTPSQPDRMDRIEAALERLEQSQEATQAQLDRQIPVIADLRATAEALLQTAQIHQQNFERLIVELNRHRSDGQGG